MSKVVRRSYSTIVYDKEDYEIKQEWDVKNADHIYTLYTKYKQCSDGWPPLYYQHKVHTGDKDWADRTAEHYNIEIQMMKGEE